MHISPTKAQKLRSLLIALSSLLIALSLLSSAALAGEQHEYRIAVDESLSRMTVEARFGSPVDTIRARARDAGRYLVEARHCGDASGDGTIRMRNSRMMLPAEGIDCMRYVVDMQSAAGSLRHSADLSPENIVVSPSLWMWRPKLSGDSSIRVRFDLPRDMQISLPWQQHGAEPHSFILAASPESSNAPAVFGRFDYREIDVAGATLRVSILSGAATSPGRIHNDSIGAWLSSAAAGVALAYGRFPHPAPQIVVMPADSGRGASSAVPFGRVIRDGGEAIELFVDMRQPLERFLSDWTATHEFSHLMLPYVESGHRWVSEGFAQYYQNVLLARAGVYEPLTAWQNLHDGLKRGRESRPELSPNEAASRGLRHGRMKIYWTGAAIALMADVALRERSGGTETLDDVLERLQACCLPSDRTWSAPELFATLDSLTDSPVFLPLYRRYADTAGFPDTAPVFERLGLTVVDNRLRVRRGAELQHVRSAITAAAAAEDDHGARVARSTARKR